MATSHSALSCAALLFAATALAAAPAEARNRHHPRPSADALAAQGPVSPDWEEPRPVAGILPPVTRERVAAPPFTGWGYGGTVPGAWPGF